MIGFLVNQSVAFGCFLNPGSNSGSFSLAAKVLSIRWSIVRPVENQWFAERIVPTVAGVFAVFFRMRRGESTG